MTAIKYVSTYTQDDDGNWGWSTEPESGGGGGSQDLAQVLVVGGDPDGNPVTGRLDVRVADATGLFFDAATNDAGTGVAVHGELAPSEATFQVFGSLNNPTQPLVNAWSTEQGDKVLTVGPKGSVTINSTDDAVAGLTVVSGGIVFPSSDPNVAGAWWDNAGTLTRSSG